MCKDTNLCRSQREAPDSRKAEHILKDTAAGAPHFFYSVQHKPTLPNAQNKRVPETFPAALSWTPLSHNHPSVAGKTRTASMLVSSSVLTGVDHVVRLCDVKGPKGLE